MSHDQYTQRHGPDASLPDRACSLYKVIRGSVKSKSLQPAERVSEVSERAHEQSEKAKRCGANEWIKQCERMIGASERVTFKNARFHSLTEALQKEQRTVRQQAKCLIESAT